MISCRREQFTKDTDELVCSTYTWTDRALSAAEDICMCSKMAAAYMLEHSWLPRDKR